MTGLSTTHRFNKGVQVFKSAEVVCLSILGIYSFIAPNLRSCSILTRILSLIT